MSEDPNSSGTGGKVFKVILGVMLVLICIGLLVFGICAYSLRNI